jgi:hypothetical protein
MTPDECVPTREEVDPVLASIRRQCREHALDFNADCSAHRESGRGLRNNDDEGHEPFRPHGQVLGQCRLGQPDGIGGRDYVCLPHSTSLQRITSRLKPTI